MDITPEQEAFVRFVLETEGRINRGRIQRSLQIGWFAATHLMNQLVDRGLAIRHTDDKGLVTYLPSIAPTTEKGRT